MSETEYYQSTMFLLTFDGEQPFRIIHSCYTLEDVIYFLLKHHYKLDHVSITSVNCYIIIK